MSDPALARCLVACPRFRYMPGMLDIYGRRIIRVDGEKLIVAWYGNPHHRLASDITVASAADFPLDLDDPATVGCVLALVREAHQKPEAYVRRCGQRWGDAARLWGVYGLDEHPHELADKTVATFEVAALVAALEAAP